MYISCFMNKFYLYLQAFLFPLLQSWVFSNDLRAQRWSPSMRLRWREEMIWPLPHIDVTWKGAVVVKRLKFCHCSTKYPSCIYHYCPPRNWPPLCISQWHLLLSYLSLVASKSSNMAPWMRFLQSGLSCARPWILLCLGWIFLNSFSQVCFCHPRGFWIFFELLLDLSWQVCPLPNAPGGHTT